MTDDSIQIIAELLATVIRSTVATTYLLKARADELRQRAAAPELSEADRAGLNEHLAWISGAVADLETRVSAAQAWAARRTGPASPQ